MTWEIKKPKLYRISEPFEWDAENTTHTYLSNSDDLKWRLEGSTAQEVTDYAQTTIDELIDFCESEAEGDNFHGMIDMANNLVILMREVKIEEDKIHQLMFKIVLGGGVHML